MTAPCNDFLVTAPGDDYTSTSSLLKWSKHMNKASVTVQLKMTNFKTNLSIVHVVCHVDLLFKYKGQKQGQEARPLYMYLFEVGVFCDALCHVLWRQFIV